MEKSTNKNDKDQIKDLNFFAFFNQDHKGLQNQDRERKKIVAITLDKPKLTIVLFGSQSDKVLTYTIVDLAQK